MGEQTDYVTLAVVAVVGVIAILAMAQVQPASLTGHAVADAPIAEVEDTSQITFNPDRFVKVSTRGNQDYDYDGDGRLTADDSILLGHMVDEQRCRYAKDCDVDDDGDMDLYDLGALNNIILSQ